MPTCRSGSNRHAEGISQARSRFDVGDRVTAQVRELRRDHHVGSAPRDAQDLGGLPERRGVGDPAVEQRPDQGGPFLFLGEDARGHGLPVAGRHGLGEHVLQHPDLGCRPDQGAAVGLPAGRRLIDERVPDEPAADPVGVHDGGQRDALASPVAPIPPGLCGVHGRPRAQHPEDELEVQPAVLQQPGGRNYRRVGVEADLGADPLRHGLGERRDPFQQHGAEPGELGVGGPLAWLGHCSILRGGLARRGGCRLAMTADDGSRPL